jgi:hypothetical protein
VNRSFEVQYFFKQDCKWKETRTNICYILYKYYINNCRLREILPTTQQFERTVKYVTKKIVMANTTKEGLIDILLPIWTGRELEKNEVIEILEEGEGDNDKGKICMSANKKTIILNTKIHLGFGFPCKPGTSRHQRLNDVRNNEKMTQKMMKPVLRAIKPDRT